MLVVPDGDVQQHVLRRLEVVVVQQGRLERPAHGIAQTVLSGPDSHSHESHAAVGHHSLHITEIDVDVSGGVYDFDDALHGRAEHFVGLREGLVSQHLRVVPVELLVVDDQQAVDVLLHFHDAVERLGHGLVALVPERDCHDADGEYSPLLGHRRDDRGRSGAGSASHPGGYEEHALLYREVGEHDFLNLLF